MICCAQSCTRAFMKIGTVFFKLLLFFSNSLATKSEFFKKCKFSFGNATLTKSRKLNLFYLMIKNNVKFEIKFFTLSIALKN